MKRWAPPGTVRPLLTGMLAFSAGLIVALLLTPLWDVFFLALILLVLIVRPLLLGDESESQRIRRWLVPFMVGALLGSLGSLGHRYSQDGENRGEGGAPALEPRHEECRRFPGCDGAEEPPRVNDFVMRRSRPA